VADYQERDCDLSVQANHHPPAQVLHHVLILVLAGAVVTVKVQVGLSQIVGFQEMVQHAIDLLAPFPVLTASSIR
jgi:hypothetical protein